MLNRLRELPLQFLLREAFRRLGQFEREWPLQTVYREARKVWIESERAVCENFESEIRSLLQAFSWNDKQRRPGNQRLFFSSRLGYWGCKPDDLNLNDIPG